ncbi:MAG: transglutaminase domain-containing protein [Eubacteriales bacterium]|nr:transglutaminase domain-containing protein [Eubacteriales bacterium]
MKHVLFIIAILLLAVSFFIFFGCSSVNDVLDTCDELSDTVSFAIGVNNISFDELYYPYYGMLREELKKVYQQLYSAVSEYKTSVIPAASITTDEAAAVVSALSNDHPELFWLGSDYKVSYLSNGKAIEISVEFNMPVEQIAEAKNKFDTTAEAIIGTAGQLTSFYEREKYVHDHILEHARYDAADVISAQSAYSALVTGKTVCAGYSKAFQYLMTRLNVPTYYCTGYSSGDHAWNIVRLDDGYYNVDLTWDAKDTISYAYFNRTDAEFSETHTRTEYSVYLPACNATGFAGPVENNYTLPEFAGVDIPHGIENYSFNNYGGMPPMYIGSQESAEPPAYIVEQDFTELPSYIDTQEANGIPSYVDIPEPDEPPAYTDNQEFSEPLPYINDQELYEPLPYIGNQESSETPAFFNNPDLTDPQPYIIIS